jgi:phage gp45-like
VRSLPVYGPGGYVWLPENGAEVLVIKGGPGGEEQCVAGLRQKAPKKGMQPGEVYLYGPGGNSIYLKQDGSVEIQGGLWINGSPYTPCNCDEVTE